MTIKSLPHWPPTRAEVLAALDAAEAAWRIAKRNLHLGPRWDRVHIQGPAGSVTRTWPEVDKAMRQRWDV